MKTIVPAPIAIDWDGDATNVAAPSESEWADTTTYTIDQLCKVTLDEAGTTEVVPHRIYKSLRANNLNKYPPDHVEPEFIETSSTTSNSIGTGSKSFTVGSGLGLVVGSMVKITHASLPNSYNMSGEVTAYSGTSLTVNVLSVTGSGGPFTTWKIVTQDEVAFWEMTEATNQFKMFDSIVNSKTVNTTSIEVDLNVDKVDGVAFFGLVAEEITVRLWPDDTKTGQALYEETVNLVYGSAIVDSVSDWWEYFFGEYAAAEDWWFDFGVSQDASLLEIIITAFSGDDAECGQCIPGRIVTLGTTEYGSSMGLEDYSIKDTDEDGLISITEGYWAKLADYSILIDNSKLNYIYKQIASLRATPTAWLATECSDFRLFLVYGVFRDLSIDVSGSIYSNATLQIEGLI